MSYQHHVVSIHLTPDPGSISWNPSLKGLVQGRAVHRIRGKTWKATLLLTHECTTRAIRPRSLGQDIRQEIETQPYPVKTFSTTTVISPLGLLPQSHSRLQLQLVSRSLSKPLKITPGLPHPNARCGEVQSCSSQADQPLEEAVGPEGGGVVIQEAEGDHNARQVDHSGHASDAHCSGGGQGRMPTRWGSEILDDPAHGTRLACLSKLCGIRGRPGAPLRSHRSGQG